jgi:hypothetical protein
LRYRLRVGLAEDIKRAAALARARPCAQGWFARWCLAFIDAAAVGDEDALGNLHAALLIFERRCLNPPSDI